MSGQGLDYGTGRRIRDFIRLNMAEPLTPQQVRVHFRLPADMEPDIRDLMTEVALLAPLGADVGPSGHEPEVVTPPAEALDLMIAGVAAQSLADYRIGNCLRSCRLCRNHLLYLLDTLPFLRPGEPRGVLPRLAALPVVHERHDDPAHPDNSPPQIRWITP